MLSQEDNEAITRIGPGTLMGALVREYWLPVLLSSELPAPDCDPVRTLVLGEKLIAFRATDGQVGIIQNHCPHRGASLFFGRNEEAGLRCVYHGWKFDVTGQCIDMPNEPAESNFKSKVRAVAYPTQERGGVIWAYLGPRSTPPPLPELEPNMLGQGSTAIAMQRECNWLQALEGDIDTVHSGLLHNGSSKPEDLQEGSFMYYVAKDRAPRYSVIDTAAGASYGAYRPGPPGQNYWRIAHYLFPIFTMAPSGLLGRDKLCSVWLPMDDEHTMTFFFLPKYASDSGAAQPPALSFPAMLLPGTTDWHGRFRTRQNLRNDFEIDRQVQRRNVGQAGYSGIDGIPIQDQAVQDTMGPIYARWQENLGTSDAMIIRVRRRLLTAARALAESGATPPGVDEPEAYHLRSGGVFLPDNVDWVEATKDLRRAFTTHNLDESKAPPALAG